MLLPKDTAMSFIGAYANLLHYAGVEKGMVREGMPLNEFLASGPDLLVKCRLALAEDPDILSAFTADMEAASFGKVGAKMIEVFAPMIQAVEQMRPILAIVLRDTEEHTLCYDIGENIFYHVKNLTEPLGDKLGKDHTVVRMVLMTYKGQVIHDGLAIAVADAPVFSAAHKRELEAAYKHALEQDLVMKPWGPIADAIPVDELSLEAFNATIASAALFKPELAAAFEMITEQCPDEDTYLDLCLKFVVELRSDPDKKLRSIFGEDGVSDHDLFLFTLDRIEGDVRMVLRKPLKSRAHRGSLVPKEPVARPATREPVTLGERLHAAVPFTAMPTRELSQLMRERGTPITLKTMLTITEVYDGPIEMGIACALESSGSGERVIAPLTYLVLPSSSSFYREVEDWRRKRHKQIAKLNAGY
jgi:hypothetical protein